MVMPLLPTHVSLHSRRELALTLGNCDNKRQCGWYCDGYAASFATTRMMFHNKSRKVRPACRFCIMRLTSSLRRLRAHSLIRQSPIFQDIVRLISSNLNFAVLNCSAIALERRGIGRMAQLLFTPPIGLMLQLIIVGI